MVDIHKLRQGDILKDLEPGFEGRTYDFGYIGREGHVICYFPGERNMQDSTAVKPEYLELTDKHTDWYQ